MRLIQALWLIAAALLLAGPTLAQEPNEVDLALNPNIAAKLKWVEFGVVNGRIVGVSTNYGTNVSSTTSNPLTGTREKVTVDITTGLPGVRYEMTNAREELAIELVEGDQLQIRRTRKGSSPVVSLLFQQSVGQELTLTLGEGVEQRELRGASIWHLLISHPAECRKHLLPVLELLRPNWRLATTANSLEEALLRRAVANVKVDRQAWTALVAELGSEKYSVRAAAEWKLRNAGYGVLAFLQGLDRKTLDAEQRERIREIIESLADQQEDSVERTVISLAADARIWLALLERETEAKRRRAADQLSNLIGRAIEFDPAADQATRKTQIDRLRAQTLGSAK